MKTKLNELIGKASGSVTGVILASVTIGCSAYWFFMFFFVPIKALLQLCGLLN